MGACVSSDGQTVVPHLPQDATHEQYQQYQQHSQLQSHSMMKQPEAYGSELPKNDLYNIYADQAQDSFREPAAPQHLRSNRGSGGNHGINGEQILSKNSAMTYQGNPNTNNNTKRTRDKLLPFTFGQMPADEKDKLRQCRPSQRLPNGSVYVGDWISNKMDGKGILTWPDGSKYEGFFVDGMRQGRGRFTSSDGDIFEGDWRANKAEGFGTQFTDLSTYTGEWCDDLQEGEGEEEWFDKSKYKGQYHNGKKHGHGVFTWYDGTCYEGNFDEGTMTGFGTMTYHNGKKYEGEFKLGKLHGKGRFTWADQKSYTGDYIDDIKHGQGVFQWPDGRKYDGGWQNGNQHGIGVFYDKQGEPRKGEWNQGVHVRWIDDKSDLMGGVSIASTIAVDRGGLMGKGTTTRAGSFKDDQQQQQQVFQTQGQFSLEGDAFDSRQNSTSDLKIGGNADRQKLRVSHSHAQFKEQQQQQVELQNNRGADFRSKQQSASIHFQGSSSPSSQQQQQSHQSHLSMIAPKVNHSSSASYLHRL